MAQPREVGSPRAFTRAQGSVERGLPRLVAAVKELSHARSMADIAACVRQAARELNGADGATFVLRDAEHCHYFDEDAIEPLWKGLKFPLDACISGWAMLNKSPVAIPDIYADARVPQQAYRPTFVKSLVMVPVRREAPVAAIGNYWASEHVATPQEIDLIQALADSTSVAMENVRVYSELEQRVRDRTAELEAAVRDLDAFSYSVSHDLRNPVGAVRGFTELLRRELGANASPKARSYLDHIATASEHMNELIEDLLELARTSRAEIKRSRVNVSELVQELRTALEEQQPERAVEFRVQAGLSADADGGLLRVVLDNLLSNAFKYSGKVDHAVIEVGGTSEDGVTTFFVRDNGAGFDPAHAARLFTPFERLHSSAEFPGTGVGLATAQRIVQNHGGRIWAESVPNHGATFYFTLRGAEA